MDMVERVSAAIIALAKGQTDGHDDYPASGLDFDALARAAIQAMREPTEEMCAAGDMGEYDRRRSPHQSS